MHIFQVVVDKGGHHWQILNQRSVFLEHLLQKRNPGMEFLEFKSRSSRVVRGPNGPHVRYHFGVGL